jgi:hypothetical protein
MPGMDEREVSADMRSATARLSDSFEERHSGGGLLFVVRGDSVAQLRLAAASASKR